jgi:hypothetical protein
MSVETSTECGDLFAALSKAQAAVTAAAKDKTNPHFRNSYADLASVWDACRGPLTDNDLSITQWPETVENGVAVTTVLGHASGQWMRSVLVMPLDAKATAQQVGSAVTYARRYMLAAVAGVAPDDDDGNAASEAPPKNKPAPKQSKPASKPEAKASPTATRSVENSECRKAWAKYAVTASSRGEKPRELASFLAEVTGKPEAEVVANEPKWNAIGESYWAKAAVAIAYAVSELPPPKEKQREPGEDADADAWDEDPTGTYEQDMEGAGASR